MKYLKIAAALLLQLTGVCVFIGSFYLFLKPLLNLPLIYNKYFSGISVNLESQEQVSDYLLGDVIGLAESNNKLVALSSKGWGYSPGEQDLAFTLGDISAFSHCSKEFSFQVSNGDIYRLSNGLEKAGNSEYRLLEIAGQNKLFYDKDGYLIISVAGSQELKLPYSEKPVLSCFIEDDLYLVSGSGIIQKLANGRIKNLFLLGDRDVTELLYRNGLLVLSRGGLLKSLDPNWETQVPKDSFILKARYGLITLMSRNGIVTSVSRETGSVLGTKKFDVTLGGLVLPVSNGVYEVSESGRLGFYKVNWSNHFSISMWHQELPKLVDLGAEFVLPALAFSAVFAILLFSFGIRFPRSLPLSALLIGSLGVAFTKEFLAVVVAVLAFTLQKNLMSLNRTLCGVMIAAFIYLFFPLENSLAIIASFFILGDIQNMLDKKFHSSDALGLEARHIIVIRELPKIFLITILSGAYIILSLGFVYSFFEPLKFFSALDSNALNYPLLLLVLVLLRLPCLRLCRSNLALL